MNFPTTLEGMRTYIALADNAYARGFTRRLLLRCYVARFHATGELMPWTDFLRIVQSGGYDFLLFDFGQSLS